MKDRNAQVRYVNHRSENRNAQIRYVNHRNERSQRSDPVFSFQPMKMTCDFRFRFSV